jgi:uncharacterized protein
MPAVGSLDIPPLSATRYSREGLLDALKNQPVLPSTEVAVAALYADEIEPDIVALLERARTEDLDGASQRLLFRGLHILGGRRFPAAYRPLIAFLRGPRDRVEALLGDAITETLSQIIAGMFDGDVEPILTLIWDLEVDEFVREAALKTFAFLTIDGRIRRDTAEAFLLRFERDGTAPADDMIWHGWMTAVALLGFDQLSGRVHAAFEDGRIPDWVAGEKDYRKLLADALRRPGDPALLERERVGYIKDVLVELGRFPDNEADVATTVPATSEVASYWPLPDERLPVRNPWRGVGRNDPCPCESGKKFKKCCMP